jgi:hypothetical protein
VLSGALQAAAAAAAVRTALRVERGERMTATAAAERENAAADLAIATEATVEEEAGDMETEERDVEIETADR